MPVCYNFTDRKTNELVSLQEVDRLFCEYIGEPCSPERYNGLFEYMCMAGSSVTMCKSGEVTEESFNEWVKVHGYIVNDEDKETFRKFLLTDFIFRAWWQPK